MFFIDFEGLNITCMNNLIDADFLIENIRLVFFLAIIELYIWPPTRTMDVATLHDRYSVLFFVSYK